jgi:hypothetical protein
MQHILAKLHFIPSFENLPDHYEEKVEVWYRPETKVSGGLSPSAALRAGSE